MLGFALGLGLAGALVMVIVTIPATREGRGPWTWWARKRAERARRLAERPVPTAEERFARGLSLRRIVGAVLHALPRRRRRREARFVEIHSHRGVARADARARHGEEAGYLGARVGAAGRDAGHAADAAHAGHAADAAHAGHAADAAHAGHAADGSDAGDTAGSDVPATAARPLREKVDERTYVAQVEAQADVAGEIVVMVKKRIPTPEVIEADPIDADIVNPRILSRSR